MEFIFTGNIPVIDSRSSNNKINFNLVLKVVSKVFKPRGLHLSVMVRSDVVHVRTSYDVKNIQSDDGIRAWRCLDLACY